MLSLFFQVRINGPGRYGQLLDLLVLHFYSEMVPDVRFTAPVIALGPKCIPLPSSNGVRYPEPAYADSLCRAAS